MTPDYQRDGVELYLGDCLDVLAQLPAESVDCCATSPPYWGLRDYGTATWEGGDAGCDHKESTARNDGGRSGVDGFHGSLRPDSDKGAMNYRNSCGKCGARRIDAQLGLEATPEEYVAKMVEVFAAVRRVLKPTGTLWLNLGDSYASSTSNNGGYSAKSTLAGFSNPNTKGRQSNETGERHALHHGLKPKDLCGIPWRVALALQADGWWLRQDIIWAKPNPMPGSQGDRCTTSHEHVFLLSKKARYYFDLEAIKEPAANGEDGTRVKRDVWTIVPQGFPGAHFATFPEKLVEPMIKAGSSEKGVCPECDKPWGRVVEREAYEPEVVPVGVRNVDATRGDKTRKLSGAEYNRQASSRTIGWRPTCDCEGDGVGTVQDNRHTPSPATVLDPFAGSCTTGVVAHRFGRRFIGIELSKEYCKIARKRLDEQCDSMALLEGVA